MIRSLLERLFVYDAWGNRASLQAARAASGRPERAIALLGHLGGAGRLWLERLQGRPQTMPVWPALGPEECERVLEENRVAWSGYLDGLRREGAEPAYTDYIHAVRTGRLDE